MQNGKIRQFLRRGLGDFIVVCISAAYVFYQILDLKPTGLELWQLIAKGLLGIVVGILIKQTLGENGFIRGYDSEIWREEKGKYNDSCNNALKYIDKVDSFYSDEIVTERRRYRTAHLQGARLKYETFFNEKGEYTGIEVLPKWRYKKKKVEENQIVLDHFQRKTLTQCIRVRVYCLNLFSEYANDSSSYTQKEKTDTDQRSKMLKKNAIVGVLIAALGAYFTPDIIDWNWGKIIIALVQVFGWITTGVLQLYDNYNYVTIDKVNKLKEKKLRLEKFKINCENGLY